VPESEDYKREAKKAQYGLRSLFVQRRLKDAAFTDIISQVNDLEAQALDWNDLEALGISPTAWDVVQRRGNSACRFFCHPDVITKHPRLVFYYRCITGLPLKGVSRLAFATASIEAGRGRPLTPDRALRLAKVFNEVMSSILDSDATFAYSDAVLLLHATAGITFDGSWRGEIGREAARRVKELVLAYFYRQELAAVLLTADGEEIAPAEGSLDAELQGFVTVNNYKIIFADEPDIEIRGPRRDARPDNDLVGVVEIKGGLDEAGAQERYGAAKKTFEKALQRRATTLTIYLASVITAAVQKAVADDRVVSKSFNLTEVLFDEESREEFLNELRWWCRL
jgi:hypothetical protein